MKSLVRKLWGAVPVGVRMGIRRMIGLRPWGVARFADVFSGDDDGPGPIDAVESVAGVVAAAPADPFRYREGEALLAQARPLDRYAAIVLEPGVERRLCILGDAGILGHHGLVYDRRSGLALQETARTWTTAARAHPFLATLRLPSPRRLSGLSLSLATLSGEGFYHFLFEALPRLHLAAPWLGSVDHVLCNGVPGSLHERWLARAGVPAGKIVWMGGQTHLHCDALLFANRLMRDQRPTAWIRTAIRSVLRVPEARPGGRRLLISRADAGTRRLRWEHELARALKDVEPVCLARLSPDEQLDLVGGADTLIGAHGAGLGLVIAAPRGGRLVELFDARDAAGRTGRRPLPPLFGRIAQVAGWDPAWAAVDYDQEPRLAELLDKVQAFLGRAEAAPAGRGAG